MVDIWKATRYIAVAGPSDFTNGEWKKAKPDFVPRPPVYQDYALLKVLYRLRRTSLEPPALKVHHFQYDETPAPLDFSHLQDSDAIFIAGHGDNKGLYAMGPNADKGMDRLVTLLTGDGNLKKLRTGKSIVVMLLSCRAGLGMHKALARRLSKRLSIDVTVGGAQGFTFGSNRTGMLGMNEVLIRGIPWLMEYETSITKEEAEKQTSAREGKTITWEAKKAEIEAFLVNKKGLENAFKDVVGQLRSTEVNAALDEIESRFGTRWSEAMQEQFELYALAKNRSKLDFDMWYDLITEGYVWTDGHSVTDAQATTLLAGSMTPLTKDLGSTR
jgi:hypothetical protein